MRLIPGIAAALVTVAGYAAPALANDHSPFLQGLREKIVYLQDHIGEDPRHLKQLGRALAALDRPSDSMLEDVRHFARAVAILEPHESMDYDILSGTWEEVHTAIYLLWDRLDERSWELSAMKTQYRDGHHREFSRFHRGRSLARRASVEMDTDRARHGNWRAAAAQLLRAAKRLDRAAVLMDIDPDYDFVQGSITATIGGISYEWTIGAAFVRKWGGAAVDAKQTLTILAHSADRHSSFRLQPLYFNEPGDIVGGGPQFEVYPGEIYLFPQVSHRLNGGTQEGHVSGTTIDALDLEAGTVSGTFTIYTFTEGFYAPVEVVGRFEITGGLHSR